MRRIILLLFVAISPILSLPVTTTTKKPAEEAGDFQVNSSKKINFQQQKLTVIAFRKQHNLEYERYLKEIVEALESDPEFRRKLNNATEDDIRSGNIAHELEYVNHQVRTRLDEIKREEMDRLRKLVTKQVSRAMRTV